MLFLMILVKGIEIGSVTVKADQIKNADVFSDIFWSYEAGWSAEGTGLVQSMCETDQYIVCFQDRGAKDKNDTISVFDRWSYELLFTVNEMNYEHGNGMTYNPVTNEILIAPYNPELKENSGMIFALDADTLGFKRRIRVSDGSWNAAAVEYVEGSNRYIVQTTKERNYAFIVLDENFNEVDYLFEGERSTGNIFQDFCVSGDFIISVPYMKGDVRQPGLHLYSISQKQYLGYYPIWAESSGPVFEPQSICQSDGGKILMVIFHSGRARMGIYEAYVPVIYTVTTAVENGQITPTRGDVDIGSNYTVRYSCTEDYELKQMQVDGADQDIKDHPTSYTFGNIQDDHSIWVKFTEIPKFEISTAVSNGSIEPAQLIRRDQDVTINYKPDTHYEIDTLIIDGQEVNPEEYENSYTFEFIQGPHSVDVAYKEIPSFTVSTKVYNGRITATNYKVYRDDNYKVQYEPKEGYRLAYMQVDGQWLDEIITKTQTSAYAFPNIQEGHDVRVVFQWEYMSLAIIGCAFAACVPIFMIYLLVMRRRRRISRRRTGNK